MRGWEVLNEGSLAVYMHSRFVKISQESLHAFIYFQQ